MKNVDLTETSPGEKAAVWGDDPVNVELSDSPGNQMYYSK